MTHGPPSSLVTVTKAGGKFGGSFLLISGFKIFLEGALKWPKHLMKLKLNLM